MKDLLYHYIEDLQQDDLDVSSHSESVDFDSKRKRSTVRRNEKFDVWVGVQSGGIFGTEVCIWNEEDGQGETETALSNPRLDIQDWSWESRDLEGPALFSSEHKET